MNIRDGFKPGGFFLDVMVFGDLNGDLAGPREYVNVAGAVNGHWTA